MKIIAIIAVLAAAYCIGVVIQVKQCFKKECRTWTDRLKECSERNDILSRQVNFFKKHLNESNAENIRLRSKLNNYNEQRLELLRKRIRHSFCK